MYIAPFAKRLIFSEINFASKVLVFRVGKGWGEAMDQHPTLIMWRQTTDVFTLVTLKCTSKINSLEQSSILVAVSK